MTSPSVQIRSAYARNIDEHPVQDADLHHRGNQSGCHLDFEEEFWRNLHIMTELHIAGELDALSRRDVAIGNKYHIGNWPAREDNAADELTDEIEG